MSNIVTFEQAKRLSILGFDKYTPSAYFKIKQIGMANEIPFGTIIKDTYQAPTVSEALDYLREEKGVACSVNFVFKYNDTTDNVNALYFGKVLQTFPRFIDQVTEDYDTHPLAESALLTAVLDYLEKKGGEG